MNNTTKAKYDLAEKMLKARINAQEVVLMSGLSEEEVKKISEKLEKENPEASAFRNLDVTDLDLGPVLYDDSNINENIEDDFSVSDGTKPDAENE